MHIALQYVAHEDLGQYIPQYAEQAKSDTLEITSQVLVRLVVLHEREICHRFEAAGVLFTSLTPLTGPQNILIAARSPICVKITDLGISKN